MQFSYDVFVALCAENGVSPSRALLNMGISKPTGSKWKKGGGVTSYTLQKVADYFQVDLESLKNGEIVYKEKKPTTDGDGLSEKDLRLIEWFRSLPIEKQQAILIAQDAPKDIV